MSTLKIIPRTTVHCTTFSQAKHLCDELHRLGYKWNGGEDLSEITFWERESGEGILYDIRYDMKIQFSHTGNAQFDVVEYEDIVSKESEMNIFGMNFEFGTNKDETLCSTVMGIAVKSNGTWRIYDAENHKIKDVGNINLGNFPVFLVPATSVSDGDLIKKDGEYYYVDSVDETGIRTISAASGKVEASVAVDNLFGINIYTKVVAIGKDFLVGESGKINIKKLLLLNSMMKDGTQQDGQNMLPLLLLSDDGTEAKTDDKLLKAIAISSCGGDQNSMLPLLLFGGDLKI